MSDEKSAINFKNIGGVLFLAIIVFGFVAGGFQSQFFTSVGQVAEVNGEGIPIKQFETQLRYRIQRFQSMMGGKPLSQEYIEQMGIKKSVLESLIQRKLLTQFAQEMDLGASTDAIAEQIKEQFTRGQKAQFNSATYKSTLRQIGMTPREFEDEIASDLKITRFQTILSEQPLPQDFAQSVAELKNTKAKVSIATLEKQRVKDSIQVSSEEVNQFIADPKNQKTLNESYEKRKTEFFTSEQVKASHILIKIDEKTDEKQAKVEIEKIAKSANPENFSELANKYTQDPSGKNKGGDLGWFSRGRMVPEFDKMAFKLTPGEISSPVKTSYGYHLIFLKEKKAASTKPFEEVKATLARDLVKESMGEKVQQKFESLATQVADLMKAGKKKELKKLETELGVRLQENAEVSYYQKYVGPIELSAQQLSTLIESAPKTVHTFLEESGERAIISQVTEAAGASNQSSVDEEQVVNEFQQSLQQDFVEKLKDKSEITMNARFL